MSKLIEIIGESAAVPEMPDEMRKVLDIRPKLAVVGRYSSGKSSLINYLLNKDLLPTDTQKVTAVPTYIFKSEEELVILETSDGFRILGIPLWEKIKYELSHTQDSDTDYRMYVRNIYLGVKDYPFDELVIIDTPGYSGSDEDYEATLEILGISSGIMFLTHIEEPLTEEDLRLIEKITQPFVIVVNKADKKWSERYVVARHIYDVLREEGIDVDYANQIIPFSIGADEDMRAFLKVEEMRLKKFIRSFFDTGKGNIQDRLVQLARSGNLSLLKILVERGTNYAFEDEDGRTLLHHAVFSKNLDLVEYLISLNLDMNAEDKEGKTPLHYAVELKSKDIVEYLLKSGANPNSTDNKLMSPLHYAARLGSSTIVKLLLNYGAERNLQDEKGNFPIHYASMHDDVDLFKLFVEGLEDSPINWTNAMKQNSLHIAVWHSNTELVKFILSLDKVNINSKDKVGRTPLHYAARNGNLEIVELLIKYGAKVSSSSITNEEPLHEAVYKGHLEVAKFLLDKGAKVNSGSYRGYPIHMAIDKGDYDMLVMLIKEGADVNAKMSEKLFSLRPLHIAAMKGFLKIAKLLLNKGAEVDVEDLVNKTPLYYALMNGHTEMVKLLLRYGANPYTGSPYAKTFANVETLYDDDVAHEML